jgi:O-antigen biosynthesis protein WbqV
MPDVFVMMRDIMIAIATFMILSLLIAWQPAVPRSVPLIACFVMITTLGGVRVLYRCLIEGNPPFVFKDLLRAEPVRLLAYGANIETDALLRSLQSEAARSYQVVGIIDDDQASRDRRIRGIKVLGSSAELSQIVANFAESSIKLASLVLPANSLPRQMLREIVDAATRAGLRAVRLPRGCDLLLKANEAFAFEPIEVTDLLGREPVALRLESIDALIRSRSVVVTGGGGSIGSELCRHLLKHGPARLVIIDHCELNLFNIQRELAVVDRDGIVQPILASVRDRERILKIFVEAQVDLVFHAAAYKHVTMVESNPLEGILTNVVGTSNVADAAAAVGAAAMIMVSTDKAVKPSSTMGLSKRIAEAYCQAIDFDGAKRGQRTRFLVVRFGNVLGSSGSVVSIFEQQIKNGGPVTVTDSAMTRYFMTIPEAVELVLQGSAFGFDHKEWLGAILVLDMGEPISIVQLARRMISLAGFVPEKDIAIEFVGMRDGEKLHEELFDDNEILEMTEIPGIRLARSQVESLSRIRHLRDRIRRSASSGDAQAIIAMLREVLADGSRGAFTGVAGNARDAKQAVERLQAQNVLQDAADITVDGQQLSETNAPLITACADVVRRSAIQAGSGPIGRRLDRRDKRFAPISMNSHLIRSRHSKRCEAGKRMTLTYMQRLNSKRRARLATSVISLHRISFMKACKCFNLHRA